MPPETQAEVRSLRDSVQEYHSFVQAHAAREEKLLEATVKNVGDLTQEIQRGTTAQIEMAALLRARHEMDKEERAAKRASDEAAAVRQSSLDKAQIEQRGKVSAWLQTQWDKWGMVIVGATIITVAPGAAPYLMQYLGLSAQQVTVVQPAPVAVQPVPAGESTP
jgi:hypothetical protein